MDQGSSEGDLSRERGCCGVCVHGMVGRGRKISGHLVSVSWEIKGGSGPGGRSWSRLEL